MGFTQYEILEDISGRIRCTAWNACVMKYYNSVELESMVAIVGRYRIKTQPQPHGDLEISINEHQSAIVVLEAADFDPWQRDDFIAQFPFAVKRRLTLKQIQRLPDGTEFDVIGIMTFVGPIVSERNKRGLAMYRWVYLKFSEGGIMMKVYSCSQTGMFKGLEVNQILDIRAQIMSLVVDSVSPRMVYLTTAWTSQITVLDDDELEEEDLVWSIDCIQLSFLNLNVEVSSR
jgi:hypothetical protein